MCDHHEGGSAVGAGRLVDISKMHRRDLVRALAGGTLAIAVAGCETNMATGRSQFILPGVTDDAMASMAAQAWAQTLKETPVYNNPAQQRRLRNVGLRIAAAAGRQNQAWEFVVFDSKELNAFVLPGGKVGFYRGLMEIADKDDHVATVLGHEVGHVVARHAAERYSQEMGTQLGLGVAGSAIGQSQNRDALLKLFGAGAQLGILLPYSRAHESEADRIGIDFMHAAGYDVREALVFWQRMAQRGGSRGPAILSTHPEPAQRMEALRQYINARGYAVV